MSENIKLTISLEELMWIGQSFEQKNKISLFSNLEVKNIFTVEMKERLVKEGIIDDRDVLNPKYFPIFKELANPKAFARLMISSSQVVTERLTYFGEIPVFVEMGINEVTLSYSANIDKFLGFVSEFTGVSTLVNVGVESSLDFEEAYMLATLMDIDRMEYLKSYSGMNYREMTFNEAEFQKAMREISDSPKWISWYIKNYASDKAKLLESKYVEVKNSLLKKGLIIEKDSKISLNDKFKKLAASFLITESIFHIVVGEEKDGSVNLSECVFLKAGNHDIISLDFGGGKVEIETVNGIRLLEIIGNVLKVSIAS
jgi:hypothetical protein